jgi:hypothetical protein
MNTGARNRQSAYSVVNRGTILLGSSRGGQNKASRTRRPCPYWFCHLYVCVCVYMHVCMYVCVRIYMYECGLGFLEVSVYVFLCVYVCM